MTLSDPLLKDLKGHIAALVRSGSIGPFSDNEETVISLCFCLEKIFEKGLIRHDGFRPWKTDSFEWFYQLVRKYQRVIPLVFKVGFEEALGNMKTLTSQGKIRLLIRICLKRRCLFVPVQYHLDNEDFKDSSLRVIYEPENSILGHEILCQIFLSLLQQLGEYGFNFNLTNSAFLDESWQLPIRIQKEIVPCEHLGITLGFPLGFPVIVEILENSSAAELQDMIGVGDIIDEINGVFVRHYYGSKIDTLFRKVKTAPFHITFIKGVNRQTGLVYLPIIKLYRVLGLDPERIAISGTQNLPPSSTQNQKSLQNSKDSTLQSSQFQFQNLSKIHPSLPNPMEEVEVEVDLLNFEEDLHLHPSDKIENESKNTHIPTDSPAGIFNFLTEDINNSIKNNLNFPDGISIPAQLELDNNTIYGEFQSTNNESEKNSQNSESETIESNLKNDSSASALNLQDLCNRNEQQLIV